MQRRHLTWLIIPVLLFFVTLAGVTFILPANVMAGQAPQDTSKKSPDAAQGAATSTSTVTGTTTVSDTATSTVTSPPTATVTRTSTVAATWTSTATPQPCVTSFSDVHASDYFYEPVRYLFCAGAISGYADHTFRPYNNVTRGQVVKIVVLAFQFAINTTDGPHFTDEPVGEAFYPYVETAYNHQVNGQRVVSGYSTAADCAPATAPCFKPYAFVTRGQLSKIVALSAGWDLLNPTTPTFADVPQSNPFYTYIETAAEHGIISGYADHAFRWSNNAIRGQLAKIVYLAVQHGETILRGIAADTWKFYSYSLNPQGGAIDPRSGLPRDNIGLYGAPQGNYTSATNIGVYLWSIVAANDMHLITRQEAMARLAETIGTVESLCKAQGFLLDWYNTTDAQWVNPGTMQDKSCSDVNGQQQPDGSWNPAPAFISAVDNGWYGVGLVVTRNFLAQTESIEAQSLAARATALLNAMDYGVFYDSGNQCADITAGQMFGGWTAGQDKGWTPSGPHTMFHYGVLNTETRITAYMGIGTHQMPGDVWWRTWRTLPSTIPTPPTTGCAIDTANFDWQGQYAPHGQWTTYNDPLSGHPVNVFEGHYVYTGTAAGDIQFVPSWGGSEFEGLMPNLVVPETTWGTHGFGLNDKNYAQMSIEWALHGLGYPVWGLSPSSTPDDSGGYDAFGAVGPAYPHALSSNANCCPYQQYAITPHASFLALDVAPQQALANIVKLRQVYPDIYGPYGFFDAVAPKDTTYSIGGHTYTLHAGQVGHRYLVLDQSMIMAALDNALENGAMQQHFATDPVGQAVRPYLEIEHFSIAPLQPASK